MVEMFDDRIEISNFGGLVKGLKPEDFGRKSVLRNPNIANLLHRIGYIEKMGTGIIKMQKLIEKAGLQPIKFEFGNFFTVTFKRAPLKQYDHLSGGGVNGGVNSEFNDRRGRILLCLEKGGKKNINQLVVELGIPKRTLERDISKIKKKGYLTFVGAPKTGSYVLTGKGEKLVKDIIGKISS
jgi:ATP-dependent DNA helicase RecG